VNLRDAKLTTVTAVLAAALVSPGAGLPPAFRLVLLCAPNDMIVVFALSRENSLNYPVQTR